MWDWSSCSEGGSVTVAAAMLASPLRASSVACRDGWPTRLVALRPPRKRIDRFGWNFSAPHSEAWRAAEALYEFQADEEAGLPPPPFNVAVDCCFAQLVGLRVNSLRLRFSSIWRMLSCAPPKTSGIGSE